MHIDFDLQTWIGDNPDAGLDDLLMAIEVAPPVYCGWSVNDAETVRKDNWPDHPALSIDSSFEVMETVQNDWDASIGFNWDALFQAYDRYVTEIDNADNID